MLFSKETTVAPIKGVSSASLFPDTSKEFVVGFKATRSILL